MMHNLNTFDRLYIQTKENEKKIVAENTENIMVKKTDEREN